MGYNARTTDHSVQAHSLRHHPQAGRGPGLWPLRRPVGLCLRSGPGAGQLSRRLSRLPAPSTGTWTTISSPGRRWTGHAALHLADHGRPAFLPAGVSAIPARPCATPTPDAQARMAEFLERCAEHDICCDSFHLSSGLHLDRRQAVRVPLEPRRIPRPLRLRPELCGPGRCGCANVKPCAFARSPAVRGPLARPLDRRTRPASRPGAVLGRDRRLSGLHQPETVIWWQGQVTTALLDRRIAATWNDSNEFEIWTSSAVAHGFGQPSRRGAPSRYEDPLDDQGFPRRAVQRAPIKRPFWFPLRRGRHAAMPRHGPATARPLETLKLNIKMGLGLALSGVSNIGHDIGGFSSQKPDAEASGPLGAVRRLHAALQHPFLERRRQRQRALDASQGHALHPGPDQAAPGN